jgi:hypothetical protein
MLPVLLALLAAARGPAPPPPQEEPEITVIGERMKHFRLDTRRDRKTGANRCLVRRSTGDAALDAALCEAALACAATETKKEGMNICMGARMTAIAQRFAKAASARR